MMARSTRGSNQRPDTLMQDRTSANSMKVLLQRTAGPYIGSVASHPDVRDAPGMSAMLPIATQSVRRNEASRRAKGDIRLRYSNCPGVLCHWTRLLAGRAYGLPMVTTLAAATGRE